MQEIYKNGTWSGFGETETAKSFAEATATNAMFVERSVTPIRRILLFSCYDEFGKPTKNLRRVWRLYKRKERKLFKC